MLKKSGFAFLADIKKTFDSVCRDFLEASLRKLNFGDYFISWFHTHCKAYHQRLSVQQL
jgi:hypothetical protein